MDHLLIAALCLAGSSVAFASVAYRYHREARRLRSEIGAAKFDRDYYWLHWNAEAQARRDLEATYLDLKGRAYLRDARGRVARATDVLDS